MLTHSSVLQMIQKNFSRKVAHFLFQMDADSVTNHDGYIVVCSGYESDTFNCVIPLRPSLEHQQLEAITHQYSKLSHPFALWILNNYRLIHEHAASCGLTSKEKDVGMAMGLSAFQPSLLTPKKGAEIEIKRVTDRSKLMNFSEVISSVFDPLDLFVFAYYRALAELPYRPSDVYVLFVAYYRDRAVSTVSLYLDGDVCGIYDLATKPEMRRKGCALDKFQFKSYTYRDQVFR